MPKTTNQIRYKFVIVGMIMRSRPDGTVNCTPLGHGPQFICITNFAYPKHSAKLGTLTKAQPSIMTIDEGEQ